jgi:Flp pilus assembly pilin Flp
MIFGSESVKNTCGVPAEVSGSVGLRQSGQDIAEYAVMLAVILVIVVGTIRLIGSSANTVFSQVGSTIQ